MVGCFWRFRRIEETVQALAAAEATCGCVDGDTAVEENLYDGVVTALGRQMNGLVTPIVSARVVAQWSGGGGGSSGSGSQKGEVGRAVCLVHGSVRVAVRG